MKPHLKHKAALVAASIPLEERIHALQAEIEAFIEARADEIRGELPREQLLMLLYAGRCHCVAALSAIDTKRRDEAIAEQGAERERAERKARSEAKGSAVHA